jgi:ubiquinone/menaquinone biosynthesis C-methylase UbiE
LLPGAEVSASGAALAFNSVAADFDDRFGGWRSVKAQRSAVRRALAAAFPDGARLIEIGGGTGTDALWMAQRGRKVLMTDAAPAMVAAASAKCREQVRTAVAAAEDLGRLADELQSETPFDGAYSVFAGLNCVSDLDSFGRGIARLLRPGAPLLLVVFGTCCPGEFLVELLRGRPGNVLRRFKRGEVPARVNGRDFGVRYHRRNDLERALGSWFRLHSRRGIGVFVPPSAAEPWISRHPRALGILEALDHLVERPLASLGDHILYSFVRTDA